MKYFMVFYRQSTGTSGGVTYFPRYNGFGDVTALLDTSGNIVVRYAYDAWGKVLSVTDGSGNAITDKYHVGNQNPFRYRGYYYDTETGFYYLQSRYYDPETGRFINGDEYVSTGQGALSANMFVYCFNNPVNYLDGSGKNPVAIVEAAIIGVVAITAVALVANLSSTTTQSGLAGLGQSIGDFFSGIGNAISNTWNKITVAFDTFAASIALFKSISQAMTYTKEKIKRESNRYDYWVATEIDSTYIATKPLSYQAAVNHVRNGGSVFSDSRQSAYKLASYAGQGSPPLSHRRHDCSSRGYYRHYHATRYGKKIGGHIFYI